MSLGEGDKLINYAIIVHVTSSSPRSLHLEKKKKKRETKKKQIGEVVDVAAVGLVSVFQVLLRTCNEAEDKGGGIE